MQGVPKQVCQVLLHIYKYTYTYTYTKDKKSYRVERTKMVLMPELTAMRSRYASMASPRPPLR